MNALPLTITLAQLNPSLGAIDSNIAAICQAAQRAYADGAQLVVFSELVLSAYLPGDLLYDADFLTRCAQGVDTLCAATRQTPGLYWVLGAPLRSLSSAKSSPSLENCLLEYCLLENCLLVLRDGHVLLRYAKPLLASSPIADERRYFVPGTTSNQNSAPVLTVAGVKIGFLLGDEDLSTYDERCHDADPSWAARLEPSSADHPLNQLVQAAPDWLVSINAQASSVATRQQRHRLYAALSKRYQWPVVYLNQVGGHDELVYDGGSFAVTPTQGVVYEAPRFEASVSSLSWDGTQFFSAANLPCSPASIENVSPLAFYRQQIILGLRDYARRCGFTQIVVGSSGGIDSALTLALAVEALGASQVVAITMPSRFSSQGSVSDSQQLCQNLGIKLVEHPIHDLVSAYEQGFLQAFQTPLKGLALENLQARIRGTLLMEYANSFGALLLSTGNKSEIAVGYCTLYGDTNGGLNLLGDLYKTDVFALSRYLNECAGRALIPQAIIDKEPSAELAPNQYDRDSLPPYAELDILLKKIIEGDYLSRAERQELEPAYALLVASADGQALLARIKRLIARSEHKRHQAAPILRLRARAFGKAWQRPISAHYG